jgi:hypothetical protein
MKGNRLPADSDKSAFLVAPVALLNPFVEGVGTLFPKN